MTDLETLKSLRVETGVSITECQRALEEGGSVEKAREILRARGAQVSRKKSGRTLSAGVVQAYVHTTSDIGAIVELLCETDFVAKNKDFRALARNIALHITAFNPPYKSRNDISEDEMQTYIARSEKEVPNDATDTVQKNKLNALLRECVLLEQSFIKDESRTIQDLLDEATQKFGERTEVGAYTVLSVR